MTVKIDQWDASLTIVHPALVAVGKPFMESLMLGDQWMDYSFEFANFIGDWAVGDHRREAYDIRNFGICVRKSAYSQILINPYGNFTEVGGWIRDDILAMLRVISRYYQQVNREYPNPRYVENYQKIDKLDELFLTAIIKPREQQLLRMMYIEYLNHKRLNNELTHDEDQQIVKLRTSAIIPLEDTSKTVFAEHPDTKYKYLDTSKFRKAPTARRAMESLLKLSLVDYVTLNRREMGLSPHGRPLKGGKIAPCGIRFMELLIADSRQQAQMSDMSNSVVVRQDQFDQPGRSTQPAHSGSSKSGITEPARTPHPRSFEPFPSAEQVAERYVDDPATTFITNHDDTTRMFDGTTITFNPNGVVKHATFGKYADYVNDLIKQDVVMGWNDLEPVLLEMKEEKS